MAGRCFHRNDAELFPLFHLSALRADFAINGGIKYHSSPILAPTLDSTISRHNGPSSKLDRPWPPPQATATAAYDRRPIEVIIDIIRVEMRRMILS